MSYPDQTIMAGGEVPGNCFQAALAGVLGVSLNAVPHFALLGIHHWMHACVAWLEVEHGLIVNTSPDPTLGKVRLLHIINGQSPRGYSHAVIGDTESGDMVHDPHPSRAGLTFINSRFYFHQKAAAGVTSAGVALESWPVPEDVKRALGVNVGPAADITDEELTRRFTRSIGGPNPMYRCNGCGYEEYGVRNLLVDHARTCGVDSVDGRTK